MSNLTLAELAAQRMPPKWKFWKGKERLFWLGAMLADYARRTGSEFAEKSANEIYDLVQDHMLKNYKPPKVSLQDPKKQ